MSPSDKPGPGPRKGAGGARPAHPSQRARRRRVAAEKLARTARLLACDCDRNAKPPISDALRGLGYEVVAHHSLADAVREAATNAFDVVVASLAQADDERLRLLGLLRRALPGVPLVIVTSDGSLEMRKRCLAARPYYFAVRPLGEAELRTVISGALERPRSR